MDRGREHFGFSKSRNVVIINFLLFVCLFWYIARVCSISPILFSVFISDLLNEIGI